MNPITWTFPHGHVRDGRISRFAGMAYGGRIEVEMVGSAPDGWCALLYRRGSPLPAVTLSMAGPSVVPLQNAMQVVAERLMRAEGGSDVIEDELFTDGGGHGWIGLLYRVGHPFPFWSATFPGYSAHALQNAIAFVAQRMTPETNE